MIAINCTAPEGSDHSHIREQIVSRTMLDLGIPINHQYRDYVARLIEARATLDDIKRTLQLKAPT